MHDCGTMSESDCDPAENNLVDEVEVVFEYLTKKKYPAGCSKRDYPDKINVEGLVERN